MANQPRASNSFGGSQDILFPEDAPDHLYESGESVYYSPPSNSSQSSYTQDVRYMFQPEDYPPQYIHHHQSTRHSPTMDRLRRRSLHTLPKKDLFPYTSQGDVNEHVNSHMLLSPMARNPDLDKSMNHTPLGLQVPTHSDNKYNNKHLSRTPRYDSRSTSSSRCDRSPRLTSSNNNNNNTPDFEDQKPPESPKVYTNTASGNLLYRPIIPAQEFYSPPLNNKPLLGSRDNNNRPSIRPPPNWCKLYMDDSKEGNGHPQGNLLLQASRRRTWSPPVLSNPRKTLSNFSAMRCYRSNEQLDCIGDVDRMNEDGEGIYEDIDNILSPPQITPVSGFLNTDSQKLLIKPVACKPIMPPRFNKALSPIQQNTSSLPPSLVSPRRKSSTPGSERFAPGLGPHQDDGYVSQEYSSGNHSHSTSNTSSQNSSSYQVSDNDRSMSHPTTTDNHKDQAPGGGGGGGGGGVLFNVNRLSTAVNGGEGSGHHHPLHPHHHQHPHQLHLHHQLTPSPSDSGVGEFESIMRDKDAEIQHLRETMDHNETVIFQVYEDKRKNWADQLKDVVSEWEKRLQHHRGKSTKMEQTLLLQLFKLQQERNGLRLDAERLRSEKSQFLSKHSEFEKENKTLAQRLEEQQWDTAQKAGEVSLLKAQLKDAKESLSFKDNDSLCIKTQLKEAGEKRSEQDKEIEFLRSEVKRLTEETLAARSELERVSRLWGRPKADKPVQTEESRVVNHDPSNLGHASNLSENPPGACGKDVETTTCETDDLAQTKAKLLALQELYEKDKEQWLVEKDKVINYQKHLQLNYVQMFRKNKMLELEMEQLMVELENKDLTLSERLGSDASEGFESTC